MQPARPIRSTRCCTCTPAWVWPSICSQSPAGSTRWCPAKPRSCPRFARLTQAQPGGGSTGAVTNRLFDEAIVAGKRIRSETSIGAGGASVASVAADVARQRLDGLGDVTALVIGAGKIAQLTAANLSARGVERFIFANRTGEGAAGMAARFGGESVAFEDLGPAVARADVIVSSTSAPGLVVVADGVPAGRRVFIDLALPRDIDPRIADVEGASVINIDELEEAVRRNIALREGEYAPARRSCWSSRRVRAVAGGARSGAGDHLAAGPRRADSRGRAGARRGPLEGLTPADRARLDAVTRSMLAKLLHRPTVRLEAGRCRQRLPDVCAGCDRAVRSRPNLGMRLGEPRQRAGAGAGRTGGRSARRRRDRADLDRRRS